MDGSPVSPPCFATVDMRGPIPHPRFRLLMYVYHTLFDTTLRGDQPCGGKSGQTPISSNGERRSRRRKQTLNGSGHRVLTPLTERSITGRTLARWLSSNRTTTAISNYKFSLQRCCRTCHNQAQPFSIETLAISSLSSP